MMWSSQFWILSTIVLLLASCISAQFLASKSAATIRQLQHLYLDAGAFNLPFQITPCSKYIDPTTGLVTKTQGRITAAAWVRTAFHDFVAVDTRGSGGLDASIGFETGFLENTGTAFTDSLAQFSYYFSSAASMADLIAAGLVIAVGRCGGTQVALSGGRVDATGAGAQNVINPTDPPNRIFSQFFRAGGFNPAETLTLTACGHSFGGVSADIFTGITERRPKDCVGQDCRISFDSTPDTLDTKLLTEYLNGTGSRGGPLVTAFDPILRSDLRLFSADRNATIRRLSQSTAYFQSQCSLLFARMINTVSSSVILTPDITPQVANNIQVMTATLSISLSGTLTLKGILRFVKVADSAFPATSTLDVGLISRGGGKTSISVSAVRSAADTGTSIVGPTFQYPFTLDVPLELGLGGVVANGQKLVLQDSMFPVSDQIFIRPALPPFSPTPDTNGAKTTYTITFTAAVLITGHNLPTGLTATLSLAVPQSDSVAPKIDSSTVWTLTKNRRLGKHNLYNGRITVDMTVKQTFGFSIDVAVPGQAPGIVFWRPFNADD